MSEVESKTLSSRPRIQKKSEAKASFTKGRTSQGHECSRPRPRTKDKSSSALQRKKDFLKNLSGDFKKETVFTKIFQAIFRKKRLPKSF